MGDKAKSVHFMGIGGSGMSGIAQIAKSYGFTVSGCDLQTQTPYLEKLTSHYPDIKVSQGHSVNHLDGVDILAVTPAIFFQNSEHPEFLEAKNKDIVMTWQKFMGEYLHKDKFVICIAGTHGKSTTTTMAGLLLEQAQLDPTVEVGATVPAWENNVRFGESKYFVTEADEYYHNFLNYHPDMVILNNIEMDHPEYFKTQDNLESAFLDFIKNIKPGGTLIYNADNAGNQKLVSKLPNLDIKIVSYSISDFPKDLKMHIPGNHNKSNALGIIKLAEVLNINSQMALKSVSEFTGIGRRIELLGQKNEIKVYDDYANHPTAFAASISAVKEENPNSKIWSIIEPHTFSRLRAVLEELPTSLKQADHVIITKIFESRETNPGDFNEQDIASATQHPHVQVIKDFEEVVAEVKSKANSSDVILVMGSGDSYKLSRAILNSL